MKWADAFHERWGKWPTAKAGEIREAPWNTWSAVDHALYRGHRGMRPGSSLARFLHKWRGVTTWINATPLSHKQILAWADHHHEQNGEWPAVQSGPIPAKPSERWATIEGALQRGGRGLPGGDSLARLLARYRGKRNRRDLPDFEINQILSWADAHFARTGRWPHTVSGPIQGVAGETWAAVDAALRHGSRGMPGGSSLPLLLLRQRDVTPAVRRSPLTVQQILSWADGHHRRTGRWPTLNSAAIAGSHENWGSINRALSSGGRGLPQTTLARLLIKHRGARDRAHPPELSYAIILRWVDRYRERTGRWPTSMSGPIEGSNGETWLAVYVALTEGKRGLPGGQTLAGLIAAKRGARISHNLPHLTDSRLLEWADAHYAKHRRWPSQGSGIIAGSNGETWSWINQALVYGLRGLPKGSTLARFLEKRRGHRRWSTATQLRLADVLNWAQIHRRVFGDWPRIHGGRVLGAPQETWSGIYRAFKYGQRGLPQGSGLKKTLARILEKNQ